MATEPFCERCSTDVAPLVFFCQPVAFIFFFTAGSVKRKLADGRSVHNEEQRSPARASDSRLCTRAGRRKCRGGAAGGDAGELREAPQLDARNIMGKCLTPNCPDSAGTTRKLLGSLQNGGHAADPLHGKTTLLWVYITFIGLSLKS